MTRLYLFQYAGSRLVIQFETTNNKHSPRASQVSVCVCVCVSRD
jgi:hypothetical protein